MVDMRKYDLPLETAVVDTIGEYGITESAVYTHPRYGTVVDIYYPFADEVWQVPPEFLERTPSCECGNPFSLCHPEA